MLDTSDTVLLQLECKTYYSLNITGTQIWQGLKQGMPLPEISRQLQGRHAVAPEQADRSVLALVGALRQHLDAGARPPRRGRRSSCPRA